MTGYQTLWQLVKARAQATPEARFLLDEDGHSTTFGAFEAEARRLAAGLSRQGVTVGSKVAWQLPTWRTALLLCAALGRLGALQIPLFMTLREREVSQICAQSAAGFLVSPVRWQGFDYEAMVKQVQLNCPGLRLLFADKEGVALGGGEVDESAVLLETALDTAEDLQENLQEDEPVRWIYGTSGTTAQAKLALHTDSSFISTAYAMNALLELRGGGGDGDGNGSGDGCGDGGGDGCDGDIVPLFFPFAHVGGLIWLMSCLMTGCQCLLVERFHEDSIRFADRNGTTVAGAGTAFHLAYLGLREKTGGNFFARVRCFPGGGAVKPQHLHREMQQAFNGAGIISGYGLTECPIITMNSVRDPDDKLALTEGRPLPGMQVKIVNRTGELAAVGEEGEICVKGPHLMRKYLDDNLNSQAFDAEGYFRTGDLGYLDEGGWLAVTGRLKDIIIRKGENISAKKIEDLLFQHPQIVDVAVVGLPDSERGEIACAFVQQQPKQRQLTLADIKDFCLREGLVIQEVPEQLCHLPELPRNPSGKVQKEMLKARYMDREQAGATCD